MGTGKFLKLKLLFPPLHKYQGVQKLATKGKTPDLVLKPDDDWKSSAELYDCPQWLQLVGMIQHGEVGTLCCLDRDRLRK